MKCFVGTKERKGSRDNFASVLIKTWAWYDTIHIGSVTFAVVPFVVVAKLILISNASQFLMMLIAPTSPVSSDCFF
ncbi:MAG: hypothetical protein ACJ712_11810 [Nitrososphaeraceae archaeon]